MSRIKNCRFVGAVNEQSCDLSAQYVFKTKTRQIQIAYSLVIFVFDGIDSYFLPDHICTLSSIIFAEGCAWQFVTKTLASGAYTP